jgi:hypothetical protein
MAAATAAVEAVATEELFFFKFQVHQLIYHFRRLVLVSLPL